MKYSVRLYYHAMLEVEVEAENSQEAIEEAREKAGSKESGQIILENLQEDDSPEVIRWNCGIKGYEQ